MVGNAANIIKAVDMVSVGMRYKDAVNACNPLIQSLYPKLRPRINNNAFTSLPFNADRGTHTIISLVARRAGLTVTANDRNAVRST